MAKILVSLMGEQTAPNIIVIQELKHLSIDRYVFVTTSFIQKKPIIEWICSVCNIDQTFIEKVEVVEDDLGDINQKLSEKIISNEDEYFVNVTGGTKIMAVGVLNFFEQFSKVHKLYSPIRKNIIREYFPDNQKDTPVSYKISVTEYLRGHGIDFKILQEKNPPKGQSYTYQFFQRFIEGDLAWDVIDQLRIFYRNKTDKIEKIENTTVIDSKTGKSKAIPNLSRFLEEIDFPLSDPSRKLLTDTDSKYLTGGWFEEYVYHKIRTVLNLQDGEIYLGIEIPRKEGEVNQNDLDVVFVYKNEPYIIECKTGMGFNGREVESGIFNETVYKMASLRSKFGLSARNCLFTLSNLSKDKNSGTDYLDRAKVLNVTVADRSKINDEHVLEDFILEIVGEKRSSQTPS